MGHGAAMSQVMAPTQPVQKGLDLLCRRRIGGRCTQGVGRDRPVGAASRRGEGADPPERLGAEAATRGQAQGSAGRRGQFGGVGDVFEPCGQRGGEAAVLAPDMS